MEHETCSDNYRPVVFSFVMLTLLRTSAVQIMTIVKTSRSKTSTDTEKCLLQPNLNLWSYFIHTDICHSVEQVLNKYPIDRGRQHTSTYINQHSRSSSLHKTPQSERSMRRARRGVGC